MFYSGEMKMFKYTHTYTSVLMNTIYIANICDEN